MRGILEGCSRGWSHAVAAAASREVHKHMWKNSTKRVHAQFYERPSPLRRENTRNLLVDLNQAQIEQRNVGYRGLIKI